VRTEFSVQTRRRRELVDITAQVQRCVAQAGLAEAVCLVFTPHTTAAITLNENADPDVQTDLIDAFEHLLGDERRFRHAEGNSGAHALASLVGPSVLVPVTDGRLALGTWQALYLCEFDGPRQRSVSVHALAADYNRA
jgi:secondary thiamine-phosphate synthase enzyme